MGAVRTENGAVDSNQLSLVPYADYFLTNTPGAIGTTAGTNKVKVGIARASTSIQIQKKMLLTGTITPPGT